jgi:hypothetical protein
MIIHRIILQIKLEFANEFEGLFLKIEKKAGLGTAYVHGFKWAL